MSQVVKETGNVAEPAKEAGKDDAVMIDAKALPAFCPNPAMTLWNQHPRVYLDLGVTGEAMCPYCGTRYRIEPGSKIGQH